MIYIDDKIQQYSTEEIAAWIAELPQWRREQVLAYKHEAGRRQSLLAYHLLCQGLREEYGITTPPDFTYHEHGKPYLSGERRLSSIHFSLSHCREAVACVINEQLCGIDIESTDRRVSDSLIRYSMNDEEQAEIAQAENPAQAFLRLWTKKEAVLKLLGTGIRDDMKDILADCPYGIETRETERYIISIAVSRA